MKLYQIFFLIVSFTVLSQEKEKAIFFGGFESNSQWYLNDTGLLDEDKNPTSHPDNFSKAAIRR